MHSKIPHMSGCVIWWKLSLRGMNLMYQRKLVQDLMLTLVCQTVHCSDVVNNNSGVDFEQSGINKLPYGMLLNSNLI
jgi:hypothetical protein